MWGGSGRAWGLGRGGPQRGSSGKRSCLSPAPPPSRVPALASVPRSHRRLGPAAPAHVGPEAGGARGALCLTPQLLRGLCSGVCGAARCRPVLHAGLRPVGTEVRRLTPAAGRTSARLRGLHRVGTFPRTGTCPQSRDRSVHCVALRSSKGRVRQEDTGVLGPPSWGFEIL